MKRHLIIEWFHPVGISGPLIRTSDTGKPLQQLLDEIRPLLGQDGISVEVVHADLPGVFNGDQVRMNGIPLETLIGEAASGQARCQRSGCMQSPGIFPQFFPDGPNQIMEAPEIFFRKAILLALEDP